MSRNLPSSSKSSLSMTMQQKIIVSVVILVLVITILVYSQFDTKNHLVTQDHQFQNSQKIVKKSHRNHLHDTSTIPQEQQDHGSHSDQEHVVVVVDSKNTGKHQHNDEDQPPPLIHQNDGEDASIFKFTPSSLLAEDKFTEPFRPPAIEAQLKKFQEEHKNNNNRGGEDDNSVPVTQEDLDYAYANWIHPFNKIDQSEFLKKSYCGEENNESSNKNNKQHQQVCHALLSVWGLIENYIAKRTNSNAPVVTFIDPAVSSSNKKKEESLLGHLLPLCYHEANSNATIISVSENLANNNQFMDDKKRIFSFVSPQQEHSSSNWLFDRQPPSKNFGSFFISCNFIAQTFVFDQNLLLHSKSSEKKKRPGEDDGHDHDDAEYSHRQKRLSSVFSSLTMSLHVFALLRPSEVVDIEHSIDEATGEIKQPPEGLHNLWEGTVQKLRIKVEKLVTLCPSSSKVQRRALSSDSSLTDASGCLEVIAIHVLESQRACAKTWGAPLLQWGRKLVATRTLDGDISFQVQAVQSSAKGTGRKVHPLQYIPSVNLDTLLGAGLSTASRIRLLADMIRTPRYSDPLPHNWVVGRGGRAIRIDRVDHRYDRDVDETKGYWGRSTRGYLHLLGYHLCLRIHSKSGLPSVMVNGGCSRTCDAECANTCSYTKKGVMPCDSCQKCGECVEERAAVANPDGVDQLIRGGNYWCHIEYSSMHSARKKWKEWEKADRKNGHAL